MTDRLPSEVETHAIDHEPHQLPCGCVAGVETCGHCHPPVPPEPAKPKPHSVGPWDIFEVCHCGRMNHPPLYRVCPDCGCNQWTKKTGRLVTWLPNEKPSLELWVKCGCGSC